MNLREFPWQRWLPVIVTTAVVLSLIAVIGPAIRHARDEARKSSSRANLKQIGTALHNYHDVHGCFPSGAIVDSNSVAYHGWYTLIWPFMAASPYPNLIEFGRPWDDPQNGFLFRQGLRCFHVPGVDEVCSKNGHGLTHYMGNPNVLHRNSGVKIEQITLGVSETWLAGEIVGNYQPWGYPFNWRSLGTQLNDGPNTYGRPTGDGALFLRGDGSAKFLTNDVDSEILTRFQNAPPIAAPDKTATQSRDFGYGPAWTRTYLQLDEAKWEGLIAIVWHNDSGTPYTVLIRAAGKSSHRSTTIDDLKLVVTAYPEMRQLFGYPRIDDQVASMLSDLKQLEVLDTGSITVSNRGLQALRGLPNLRILVGYASEQMLGDLRDGLPECEIRVVPLPHD